VNTNLEKEEKGTSLLLASGSGRKRRNEMAFKTRKVIENIKGKHRKRRAVAKAYDSLVASAKTEERVGAARETAGRTVPIVRNIPKTKKNSVCRGIAQLVMGVP